MSMYQDYEELQNLLRSWFKEGIVMSQEVMRLYWKDLKWLERDSRCRNAKGVHCMKNCRKCDKQRDGAPLSLDQMIEVGNLPRDTLTIESLLEDMELSEALHAAIAQLSERDQKIIMLWAKGYTEREIASIIGACQKSVNNWKKAAFAELRADLKDFY